MSKAKKSKKKVITSEFDYPNVVCAPPPPPAEMSGFQEFCSGVGLFVLIVAGVLAVLPFGVGAMQFAYNFYTGTQPKVKVTVVQPYNNVYYCHREGDSVAWRMCGRIQDTEETHSSSTQSADGTIVVEPGSYGIHLVGETVK